MAEYVDHKAFKLINLIKERKTLYDRTCNENLNRVTLEQTWRDVAEELGENVAACKEKWKNIRTSYKRHLKRKASNQLKTPYYLAEYLDFIQPFFKTLPECTSTKPTSSTPKLETNNSDITTVQKFDYDEYEEDSRDLSDDDYNDMQTDHIYISPSNNSILENDSSVNQEKEIQEQANEHIQSTNSKEQESLKRKLYSSLMGQSEEIRKKSYLYNCYDDPELAFFRSLLPDLRRMNNRQKIRLKLKILTEINNILYANDADFE